MSGRADERTGADNGRMSGRGRTMGGRADWRTGGWGWAKARTSGWADGLANWRTGRQGRTSGRRISEGKTPNLTRELTWPWEIQRGRHDLPPPSQ